MDKDDVATFEKMRDLGVEFDVRKVPNDTKKDLMDRFGYRKNKSASILKIILWLHTP